MKNILSFLKAIGITILVTIIFAIIPFLGIIFVIIIIFAAIVGVLLIAYKFFKEEANR